MSTIVRKATSNDRDVAIRVLARAFETNPAVNDTVLADKRRPVRMIALMAYLFDTAFDRGGVYVSDDVSGVAIVYDPALSPPTMKDFFRQLKLVHQCIGWSRLVYTNRKDKKIRGFRPSSSHLYLQMIGTIPEAQGKGIGTALINFIQEKSRRENKMVYLETSVQKNVELYLHRGFRVFGEWKIRDDYYVRFMCWPN